MVLVLETVPVLVGWLCRSCGCDSKDRSPWDVTGPRLAIRDQSPAAFQQPLSSSSSTTVD